MRIIIDPKSNYSIYEQIAIQIKSAIASGQIKADEALPSILKELMKNLKKKE